MSWRIPRVPRTLSPPGKCLIIVALGLLDNVGLAIDIGVLSLFAVVGVALYVDVVALALRAPILHADAVTLLILRFTLILIAVRHILVVDNESFIYHSTESRLVLDTMDWLESLYLTKP